MTGRLDAATLSLFSQIIARFVVAWQQAEEEKKQKELEKESLYKCVLTPRADVASVTSRSCSIICDKVSTLKLILF